MEEFKGTRGPWFVSNEGNLLIRDESGLSIVAKYVVYINDEEEVANAKLISAAPELLEALQEMVSIVKKNTYPQPDKPNSNYARAEFAESVISKALGK